MIRISLTAIDSSKYDFLITDYPKAFINCSGGKAFKLNVVFGSNGKPTLNNPVSPQQSSPLRPFQKNPLCPAQNDPLRMS